MEAGPRDRPEQDQRQHMDEQPHRRPDDELASLPLTDDGPSEHETGAEPEADAQSFRELRPQRRMRIWQLIPIVGLGTVGSLMFAFPLAFEFGDGGPVVAMLGLLLSCCSAGWAIMAARRVGYTWPGLPARGSGQRPDWRFVAGYTAFAVLIALLAVWRVARLR
ncbi:hypothetical protein ABZ746_21575 [Streptomyces sp. NPDC020096]|jgi:hypothetical protein